LGAGARRRAPRNRDGRVLESAARGAGKQRRAGNSEHELFSANPVKIYEKSLRPVARAMIAQVIYEGWKNERELTPANPVKSHKES
jgi:hypothetical protein